MAGHGNANRGDGDGLLTVAIASAPLAAVDTGTRDRPVYPVDVGPTLVPLRGGLVPVQRLCHIAQWNP
jgi:hypothetical protein